MQTLIIRQQLTAIRTRSFILWLWAAATLSLLSTFSTAFANTSDQAAVERLLKQQKAPEGVVFELIGRNGDYLTSALNKVAEYNEKLKQQFPGIEVAVVSHGAEQFALTTSKAGNFKQAHQQVKKLTDNEVPVHVCETHASWRGVSPEDYPEYIDVAPQGPIQIRQYEELGFIKIVVD